MLADTGDQPGFEMHLRAPLFGTMERSRLGMEVEDQLELVAVRDGRDRVSSRPGKCCGLKPFYKGMVTGLTESNARQV